jgi:hypothetical protein
MAKTKQGDILSCSACGLVVTVDEVCGCIETVVVCCDQPMAKGKLAAGRARKKAAVKANPGRTVKAMKTGGTAKAKADTAKAITAPAKAKAKITAKPFVKPAAKKTVKAPRK